MRRFITKTVYMALPILVVAILMEVLLRYIPNDYLLKKNYLDDNTENIETLILGSSHSYYGLNPEFFLTNTFNASHISQSLDFDFEILKKYQATFNHLKTIILPISYFTLYGKLEAGAESWRIKNYTIYYEINTSKSISAHSEVLSNQLSVNMTRLVSYYILGESQITCSKLGWGIFRTSYDDRGLVETGKTAAKRHTRDDIYSDKYQKIFDDNKLILDSIISWCDARNIKLLFLTPPAFETYSKNLNIEQLNSMIETIGRIASENENCIYLNLMNDTNFNEKDFFDADHLSKIGATKLSTQINELINDW